MLLRDSALSCALALVAAVAACADSSGGTTHGPVFYPEDSGFDAYVPIDGAAPPPDASSNPVDGSAPPVDASSETSGDAASCTSTLAILACGSSTLDAAVKANGVWSTSPFTGSCATAPALVATGNGFVAVSVDESSFELESTTFTTSWSAPARVGTLAAGDAPALAVVGADVHLVYLAKAVDASTDDKFFHGTYSSGAWDAADDPVGNPQSFGQRGPSAASAGGDLVIAQSGTDGFLYDQSWNGSWQAAEEHPTATLDPAYPPTLTALTGGSADLLVVYLRSASGNNDHHLTYTTRSGGTWSAPAEVYDMPGNVAFSVNPVSVASMSGGRAALAFLGTDGKGYSTLYDPTLPTPWTAPAPIDANAALASPPQLATGLCGGDAVAAYVTLGGGVEVTTLSGGTWSSPEALQGITGATYAAIGTSP